MRFAFIHHHRTRWPVWLMCRVLKVSRSGYYAWRKRPPSAPQQRREELARHIRAAHAASRGVYGSPRIHRELLAAGVKCCVNTVARIMHQLRVFSKMRRKFIATSNSRHAHPTAPNALDRCFDQKAPDRVWAADITYIPTGEGWLFLAVVLDLCSRKIVGYAMADHMRSDLATAALRMAIERRRPPPCSHPDGRMLMHHSDRGAQYASAAYQDLLAAHGISCSMSRAGDCWDNAAMESFFGTLKTELIHHQKYATRAEAQQSIFEYIECFYNPIRRHSKLDYVSPNEYEHHLAA